MSCGRVEELQPETMGYHLAVGDERIFPGLDDPMSGCDTVILHRIIANHAVGWTRRNRNPHDKVCPPTDDILLLQCKRKDMVLVFQGRPFGI
jgi:hypothetical protein